MCRGDTFTRRETRGTRCCQPVAGVEVGARVHARPTRSMAHRASPEALARLQAQPSHIRECRRVARARAGLRGARWPSGSPAGRRRVARPPPSPRPQATFASSHTWTTARRRESQRAAHTPAAPARATQRLPRHTGAPTRARHTRATAPTLAARARPPSTTANARATPPHRCFCCCCCRLTDCLISSNGIISQKLAGKVRYMDSTCVLPAARPGAAMTLPAHARPAAARARARALSDTHPPARPPAHPPAARRSSCAASR